MVYDRLEFQLNRKTFLSISAVAVLLIVFGYLFLDIRLAKFVSQTVGRDFLLSTHVSNIHDSLSVFVYLITIVGWVGHFSLARKAAKANSPDIFMILGSSVPLSYVLKDIVKHVVGRTNTRVWLVAPELDGLHWFHGGGIFCSFPSGHMAVFTALMLGISRYYPRLRHACLGFMVCLALALIATEYHYFSDIIAGTYLGMIVDLLTWQCLSHVYGAKKS